MNNRKLTIAEEHLYADVKQAISAIEIKLGMKIVSK